MSRVRKKVKRFNYLKVIYALTLTCSIILAVNVFLVSVFKVHVASQTNLGPYIESSNLQKVDIKARRGYIFDRNGNVVAQDITTYDIICYLDESRVASGGRIAYVQDPRDAANKLAPILGMDEEEIYRLLSSDKYQTELGTRGRKLSKEKKDEILALNIPGIEFIESKQRYYPYGSFAPYIVGFAQSDENQGIVGKMGLELILNAKLQGTDGQKIYQADKYGYILPGMRYEVENEINGNDVYLTIDLALQEALQSAFELTYQRFGSEKIWGAVMEIDTGRMLAYGQYPGFDLNKKEIEDYTNYGMQMPYEPGSTMKVFGYAAAIDSGKYDGSVIVDSSTYCYGVKNGDFYRVPVGDSRSVGCINNASKKSWGMIPYDMGLVYSSNTLMASLLENVIDKDIYSDYLERFHFFEPVNTDGLPEVNGVKNYTYPADQIALMYGQGSTVTMLQLMQAYSAILGDGKMVKPYFVEQIKDAYDPTKVVYQAQTEIVGTPISESTAKKVQELMYQVVNNEVGTGRFYKIDEVDIIAKTGTAQVSSLSGGGYNTGDTIASIAVGLPADDPKYMVYYAFQGNYNSNAHYDTSAVKYLLQKVTQIYNLSKAEENFENTEDKEVAVSVEEILMPQLINHTYAYAIDKLEKLHLNYEIIGNGSEILKQIPQVDTNVSTNEKIFILTDIHNITMPDMQGWTRVDVMRFSEITKVAVKIDGSGTVVSQSIPENTSLSTTDVIEIKLE